MAFSPQNQKILIGVAVLAAGSAAWMAFRPEPTMPPIVGMYFYDLKAETLYVEKPDVESPTVAPSGGEGVAAAVFACGTCEDPATHVIGYLTKNSDAYMRAIQSSQPVDPEVARVGTLFRPVRGGAWANRDSPATMSLIQGVQGRCSGSSAVEQCQP